MITSQITFPACSSGYLAMRKVPPQDDHRIRSPYTHICALLESVILGKLATEGPSPRLLSDLYRPATE